MNNLKLERHGGVVTVRLHRPHVRNALSSELLSELLDVLRPLDADPEVGCYVVTGSERVFAAGAAIRGKGREAAGGIGGAEHFARRAEVGGRCPPTVPACQRHALGRAVGLRGM